MSATGQPCARPARPGPGNRAVGDDDPPEGRPNGGRTTSSVLVAVSAALGWRYDHLRNILDGHPGSNTPVQQAALESALLKKLNEEIRKLKTTLRTVELLADKLRNL